MYGKGFDPTRSPDDYAEQSAIGDLPDGCHPRIRAIYEYWRAIHPTEGLPGRQHFDPLDIPALLPDIFLLDVRSDGPSFQFRLIGTGVTALYGREFTGQPFEAAYEDGKAAPIYQDACAILTDKAPRWRRSPPAFQRSRDYLLLERLLLPLAENGATVDILLGFLLVVQARETGVRQAGD